MDSLQQNRERIPLGEALSVRAATGAAPVRSPNRAFRQGPPAGLRREAKRLREELAQMQELAKQGQERLARFLHNRTPRHGQEAERDLLHVQARLEGLQIQAVHTARLVQRLMGLALEQPDA